MSGSIARRQQLYGSGDYDPTYNNWWYSPTAYIIKWVITIVIVAGIFLYFGLGYWHAHRRMKKGLQPLRYHRFLVTQQQRAYYFPNQYPHYQHPPGHGPAVPLQQYGPAPPGYHENDYVPAYEPPQGSTKVNPDQTYTAPVGAPPGWSATAAGASSSSSNAPLPQPPQPSARVANV